MKYKLLFEKGKYSLIQRGENMTQYAVVNDLDKEHGCWAWTVAYADFGMHFQKTELEALQDMIDVFRAKTEPDYIPRCRLVELATQFKDAIIEDIIALDRSDEDVMHFFDFDCDMTEEEKEWFGIGTESEEK